ncbi:hypothetical protein Kpol_1044p1 [Vanderwaltozyma polyspora DSM 70294]|uniref:Uncharacterized protein n=1 Tax=Vanderwaltozyma polyspora (strain ATCC 22028 / DSM 70294 / BCRC 21397 / CBS 2163 / NBRC 10782 / NRRL Y-8283 / UCD 57-17) TaxID=436907 RepID=A7TP35_VANPO|nr:uncharacterized protein Kpol_1044p1 [Vanderwaltozyma polyspora DSM 70294]EDO15945.1 hypothetical protein Kpol_1044p1 [Vanderwaltozyma polyspora DSM 70294]
MKMNFNCTLLLTGLSMFLYNFEQLKSYEFSLRNKKKKINLSLDNELENFIISILNSASLYLLVYTVISMLYWRFFVPIYILALSFIGLNSFFIIWLQSMLHINFLTLFIVKQLEISQNQCKNHNLNLDLSLHSSSIIQQENKNNLNNKIKNKNKNRNKNKKPSQLLKKINPSILIITTLEFLYKISFIAFTSLLSLVPFIGPLTAFYHLFIKFKRKRVSNLYHKDLKIYKNNNKNLTTTTITNASSPNIKQETNILTNSVKFLINRWISFLSYSLVFLFGIDITNSSNKKSGY